MSQQERSDHLTRRCRRLAGLMGTVQRHGFVLLGTMLVLAAGCTPRPAVSVTSESEDHPLADGVGDPSDMGEPSGHPTVTDRSGSQESELDVWVTFTGKDWDRVWTIADMEWATDTVIAILLKYKPEAETYFATLPGWATQGIPWRARIRMEIGLHRMAGDNDIHFSEWWLARNRWH
jgi:hypothetical protein